MLIMQLRNTTRVGLTALLSTPVIDSKAMLRGKLGKIGVSTGAGRVVGVVHADHGISFVREKL
jgi:hypothetical protein